MNIARSVRCVHHADNANIWMLVDAEAIHTGRAPKPYVTEGIDLRGQACHASDVPPYIIAHDARREDVTVKLSDGHTLVMQRTARLTRVLDAIGKLSEMEMLAHTLDAVACDAYPLSASIEMRLAAIGDARIRMFAPNVQHPLTSITHMSIYQMAHMRFYLDSDAYDISPTLSDINLNVYDGTLEVSGAILTDESATPIDEHFIIEDATVADMHALRYIISHMMQMRNLASDICQTLDAITDRTCKG